MRPLLLRGGRVIDPSRGYDQTADVLIDDGKIAAVGAGVGAPDGAEVRDVAGRIVAPGLVDVHVHLREPGNEDEETVATGARAAAAGGFTAVCAMPNTDPVTDNQAAVGFIVRQSVRAGFARVYPIGAVSVGQRGERLAEMGEMVGAGAVAVSDDGRPVASGHLMRTVLEYARTFDIPVADHCEEPTLAAGGAMHEGLVATRLGLKGIPAAAEVVMVQRDLLLAEMTGAHLHVAHVSAAGTVRAIREARARGVRVTAEATPHHFTLTDEAVAGALASVPAFRQEDAPPVEPYDTHAKMSPPLRSESDRQAIVGALSDGVIDAIATDHAPHGPLEKDVEFERAANGVIGLETSLALTLALVRAGDLALPRAVERLSSGPARCFGLPYGTLATGAPADVVLVDPDRAWKVDPQRFHSRSRNSPFATWTLRGRVIRTYLEGRLVHRSEE